MAPPRTGYAELGWPNRELALLNDIALAATRLRGVQAILDFSLRAVVDGLGLDNGMIYLFDDSQGRYVLRAYYGLTPELAAQIDRRKREIGESPVQITETGRLDYTPDMSVKRHGPGSYVSPGLLSHMEARSGVRLPLLSMGRAVGEMDLMSRPGHPFDRPYAEMLQMVARAVGIAIDNAQLFEQTRHLAALEERERLAREMHDDLAQMLGSVHMRVMTVDALLADGHVADARARLADLEEACQQAYSSVRELIATLHVTVSSGAELLRALQGWLEEYRRQGDAQVELEVEGEAPPLGAETASQLLRIVQEALTNVRKHARASRVKVRFAREGDEAMVVVEDNGQGFDLARLNGEGRRSFGLQVMRERAQSVGGSVQIDSRPGHGTTVRIRLPLA
jgi:signal transduction histidine kinase